MRYAIYTTSGRLIGFMTQQRTNEPQRGRTVLTTAYAGAELRFSRCRVVGMYHECEGGRESAARAIMSAAGVDECRTVSLAMTEDEIDAAHQRHLDVLANV